MGCHLWGCTESETTERLSTRLVITLLPKSKRLLIPWLKSPSAVILEPPKIKSDTVSTVSPFICQEVTSKSTRGPDNGHIRNIHTNNCGYFS